MIYSQNTLMEIATLTSVSIDNRIHKLLNIGLEELQMDTGIVSQIKGDQYTVLYSNQENIVGQTFKLGVTYCSITFTRIVTKVFAVEHFSNSPFYNHPAFGIFKLETYIGSPIIANGLPAGTVNFTKAEPRDCTFSAQDKQLVRDIGSAMSNISDDLYQSKS